MPVIFTKGNIFEAPEGTILVNPVNCVGVQGAGLAKQFRDRMPAQEARYKSLCGTRQLKPQHPYLLRKEGVLLFPTKDHWRDKSDLNDISMGLINFASKADSLGLTWAFPPLGCGLGGLQWSEVKALFKNLLGDLRSTIYVYEK
jgi:O-acetyl-ADP-ribose deacetylase (regulator of RNase III)